MENQVFYRCSICGNLITMLEDSGIAPVCCGQKMNKLDPGTTDASHEKHVPIIDCEERKVFITVGELPHPMSELHYIEWIWLQTTRGGHLRKLYPGEAPSARFRICASERPLCAWAWCNLHGLWKSAVCAEKEESS